ncbi:heavy metal translocating P-type ATPase [Falsirhodobacter halotolerans]|uniref:heavy metal translocating P-type ATPase n=1 Tax=Falsirhodobacter halotolerans TaxID=1146892 RepID=UPI001FD35643|nr:heavy metal translocating P-type ATPase [Falsirhodobacter halotolerans]MCJ8141106.1 cadmium-translocating P-type ATPase [Falsirhodobacter halotolerans]
MHETRREWTISGMDCAGCTQKVTRAVDRIAGVADVRVSLMTQRLSATVTRDAAPRLEEAVRRLGYGIAAHTGMAAQGECGCGHDHDATDAPWYRTGKGRLVLLTGGVLALAWAVRIATTGSLGYAAFVLACLIGVAPVARRAFAALRMGQPFTIEGLMTLAAMGALAIGAAEEAAAVVFLFAVGEVLEGVAAGRARQGIRALADLVPKTAQVEENGTLRTVPAAQVRVGQIVLVRPGDRIPADGTVQDGLGGVDESPVTGESVPRVKGAGDAVHAGSISTDAALRIRVDKEAADTTLARIIRLVEEAQEARAPTERVLDRFSRVYMPGIVGLAALVILIPPLVFGGMWETWIYRGLALLLIGCPCALVISVPAAIASALSAGARRGLLLKGGAVIEAAARTRHVAFDKTGTLTRGTPVVTDLVPTAGVTEAELMSVAAGVEGGSSHPLARAILTRAGGATPAIDARALPGRGAQAQVGGRMAWVTSPAHAAQAGGLSDPAAAARLEAAGKTVVAVFHDRAPLGLIALRDEAREDSAEGIRQLAALGVSATMLTGDNARTAAAIAGPLGLSARAGLLPEDKLTAIRTLSATGPVMMIGDGINDAPALKHASVGVAMGSGTDIALDTADAALLRDRVTDVPALIRLSRAAMGNIRQNITIALGLKAVFLVTSVLGVTGLWIAILADTGATVLVTLNALRLLRMDPTRIR